MLSLQQICKQTQPDVGARTPLLKSTVTNPKIAPTVYPEGIAPPVFVVLALALIHLNGELAQNSLLPSAQVPETLHVQGTNALRQVCSYTHIPALTCPAIKTAMQLRMYR